MKNDIFLLKLSRGNRMLNYYQQETQRRKSFSTDGRWVKSMR